MEDSEVGVYKAAKNFVRSDKECIADKENPDLRKKRGNAIRILRYASDIDDIKKQRKEKEQEP